MYVVRSKNRPSLKNHVKKLELTYYCTKPLSYYIIFLLVVCPFVIINVLNICVCTQTTVLQWTKEPIKLSRLTGLCRPPPPLDCIRAAGTTRRPWVDFIEPERNFPRYNDSGVASRSLMRRGDVLTKTSVYNVYGTQMTQPYVSRSIERVRRRGPVYIT